MEERIYMSTKDLSRFDVLTRVKNKQLKKGKAARMLGISPRQVRRLLKRLALEGPKGLISRKLGAPSNNQVPEDQEKLVLGFLGHKDHHDFGPTLTHEYLLEEGALKISASSVRNIMIKHGLWHPNEVRELVIHPLRPRRARKGELIQLDGSIHDWFEGRGPKYTLLVFIDDATSETLLQTRFFSHERYNSGIGS